MPPRPEPYPYLPCDPRTALRALLAAWWRRVRCPHLDWTRYGCGRCGKEPR
jgi:hypothetical protein